MTSPDSPSLRTEAGKRLASRELHDFDDQAVNVTAAIFDIERQAAQEAPAPDGLREAIENADADHRLAGHAAGCSVCYRLRAALAAPPSPAEPPRPDHQHHYEHDFRCGTCGATFLAVLTDDRAEARPPEGLDADRLARAIQETEHAAPVYSTRGPETISWRFLSEQEKALRLADARAIAAEYLRLSARGAEPR